MIVGRRGCDAGPGHALGQHRIAVRSPFGVNEERRERQHADLLVAPLQTRAHVQAGAMLVAQAVLALRERRAAVVEALVGRRRDAVVAAIEAKRGGRQVVGPGADAVVARP